jgi:hypothetical protein
MKDIMLKNKNELAFENGDFVTVSKQYRVVQQIYIALRTLPNDWYLDYRKGIDYGGLLKSLNDPLLKAKIRQAVKEVDGVDEITKFDFFRKDNIIYVKIGFAYQGEEFTVTEGLEL